MSSTGTEFYEGPKAQQVEPLGPDYVLTDEEKRVLKECNSESFWYRSLPISCLGMATTQFLVSKGILSRSLKFGSIPKLIFAGFIGFTAGKISYKDTLVERLSSLDSPLGEFLRQKAKKPSAFPVDSQSEQNNSNIQMFGLSPEGNTPPNDDAYGFNPDVERSRTNELDPQGQSYMEEEQPRKNTVLYKNLRESNRQNYEATLTQRSEANSTPKVVPKRPTKDVKKNDYGDTWEEE